MESRSQHSSEIFQSSQLISLNPRFLTLSSRPYMKWPQSLGQRLTALCPGRLASLSLAPHVLPMTSHVPPTPPEPRPSVSLHVAAGLSPPCSRLAGPCCSAHRGAACLGCVLWRDSSVYHISQSHRSPRMSSRSRACVCIASQRYGNKWPLLLTQKCVLWWLCRAESQEKRPGATVKVSAGRATFPAGSIGESCSFFFFFNKCIVFVYLENFLTHSFFSFCCPPTLFFFAAPGLGCSMPAPLVTACGI